MLFSKNRARRAFFALPFLLPAASLILAPSAVSANSPPPGVERTAPWNSETSDLKVDTSIIYGRLPNGMTYAIRPNKTPKSQVVVRMAIDFGSAAEEENEQGLAHFIEHMAFNGSTNVPEGEMVKMLERLGLAFGADTNASTGYTKTIYKLDLPRKDVSLIERALFLMRETASEISFGEGAVDRERGVVLAEKRQRENYQYRAFRARNAFLYPDSFYSLRYPIGTDEVLKNASAQQMKALYKKWYRPDRTRLIISGPIDTAEMEKLIAEKFSNWQSSGPSLGEIDKCTFNPARASGVAQFSHPENTENLSVLQIVPDKKRPDNFDRALLELKMEIAGAIIDDRLGRASRRQDIPYLGSGLIFQPGFCDAYGRIGFSLSAKDGTIKEVLPFVEQSIRQAAQFGFTDQEIAEQIKRQDTRFANAAKRADTRPSRLFGEALANLDDNVLNDPEDLLLLWLQIKPFLTASSIHAEFSKWHSQLDRPLIFLQSKQENDLSALQNSYSESRRVAVSAPAEREEVKFAYTNDNGPGIIVSDKRIEDLGIRVIRFANNVLLNIKKTDFEDNRIRYTYRVAGGKLHLGRDKAPLSSLANDAFVSAGLKAHDLDDLRSIFAGTTVRPTFGISEEFFGSSGNTNSEDLPAQMQLLAAYLYHPGYRENALRLYRRPLEERYARLDATPGSALNIAQTRILTDNDPRFSLTPLETVKSLDFQQLKNGLGNALEKNQLEIALVGDLDEEQAIAAVANSFAAKPDRLADADKYGPERQTTWSGKTGLHEIPHRGEADQLSWRRTWPTTDGKDQKLSFTMDLLASVATIRVLDELRENLGATYGGNANSFMSDIYPERGLFTISTAGAPKDLEAIETAVDKIIAELIAKPVGSDLFERARKPRIESFRDWRTRNSTWISITDRAQTRPDRLDRFRNAEELYKSITVQDLHAAAIRFLKDKDSYIFRALPEGKFGDTTAQASASETPVKATP